MEKQGRPQRLIVGISGASGAIIGIELLKTMREQFPAWETHLVISGGARRTIEQETSYSVKEVESLATKCHPLEDIGASIASGTFKTEGMVVVPCSMKTVAGIGSGFSTNLLLRAADVILKERRKLVLVARESPLSSIHLRNMTTVANAGAIILPSVLSFYNHPQTIEDMTRHIVGKVLDIFDLGIVGFKPWSGEGEDGRSLQNDSAMERTVFKDHT
jgi:polyprenyl P-hydroxybenzoate/phenylacrylic acid decarboxylase-like protein